MVGRKFQVVVAALASAAGLFGQPAQSHAFCNLFHRQPVVANYAPVMAAPACNTCAAAPTVVNYAPAPQVCNYVPQTAYRSVIVNVPVTAYRPIVGADPCTGCPTTAMQPVTTYMTQTRLVPYTTYRPVMATVNYAPACSTCPVAAPACSTCNTAAPVTTMMPATYAAPAAVSPGCSSCNSGVTTAPISTTTTFSAPYTSSTISGPVVSAPAGSPVISSPVVIGAPGSTLQSLQAAPSGATQPSNGALSTPNASAPKSTFAPNGDEGSTNANTNDSDNESSTESSLKPIPDSTTGTRKGSYTVPKYEYGDRTTSVQVKRAVYQAAAKRTTTVAPAVGPVDDVLEDSGWRAAKK